MKYKTCEAEYIGETTRILRVRIDVHRSSKKDNTSACKQHVVDNPGHNWDYDGVTVLDRVDTEKRLDIKQLLHILQRQPVVNKQHGLQSKYEVKTKLSRLTLSSVFVFINLILLVFEIIFTDDGLIVDRKV